MTPSYRRLQQYAIGISVISVLYNGAEGAVSIALGSKSSSRSLVFFGVQSGIEVISAGIVLWRFNKIARPVEEKDALLGPRELRIEKYASASIGVLLICLSLAAEITAIVSLSLHQEPDSSNASLIVSASALVLMIAIWLPKRYLARALDSSAMAGEATCSLSCIQITIVLFVGSLIFRLWSGGWWVDSATSLILGLLFFWEGYKLIKWVRDPNFDGGCCKKCRPVDDAQELGETYRDLCDCCVEKTECKDAGDCKCGGSVGEAPDACCSPQSMDGSKCCTHQIINGTQPERPHVDKVTCNESPEGTSIAAGVFAGTPCCSSKPDGDKHLANDCATGSPCSNESTNSPSASVSPACCATK